MLHYFTQLPKDYDLNFEKNISMSNAILHTAKTAFDPFNDYLQTTIKALDKKEDIKATWTKVKADNLVELKIIGSLYEVPKITKLKLLNIEKGLYKIKDNIDESDFDFSEKIKYKAGKIKNEISISGKNIKNRFIQLPIDFEKFDKVIWGFETLDLEPTWITISKKDKIIQENKTFNIQSVKDNIVEVIGNLSNSGIIINNKNVDFEIIEISKQPQNTKLIKEEKNRFIVYSEDKINGHNFKLQNLLNKENITFEDGTKFNAEHSENLTFKIKDKSLIGKKVICDGVKFTISELRNKDKNHYWLQLNEINEEKEDIPGFSPLKYFFDDDISIKDNSGNEYAVVQGIESEYKLILREKNTNKYNSFTFPKGKELQVRVNTYQLRKQLEAVLTLQNMPVREHSNLIKLFEKRDVVKWKDAGNEYINDWIVLTDENRSGKEEQREFLEKALSTPDFAILEGPPGSGKTTIILELICQLAKQGKRILLCGSTHVAIDNVLERLKDKKDNQTLIEKYNILPVRIGDENRINEDIREFQINNLQGEHNISENLLLDAANLVCGTTIGILQHPKFKNRRSYNRKYPTFDEPIVPEFDYLIIDESSKTTFQEFLVPGLYAKKWILAGDVMQLSPFTDREQIVTNLETLPLKNGNLPKEYQRATFYLYKLLEITKYAKNKFILPVSSKILEAFGKELIARKPKIIIRPFDINTYNRLELTASDIIIIDKNILEENIDKLPETHAILRSESWQTSQHAFIHNNWQQKGNSFKLRVRNYEFENSFDIVENTNTYFKEKSWAEEIAWRIDREHQLRLLGESKTRSYKKTIEELIPLSLDKEDIENRINNLASIAFPSILESLIKGIKGRKSSNKTTISEGFSQRELNSRRTILKYQHRMHPDISRFPREQFYKNENALLDLEKPKPIAEMRQWNYNRYAKRNIWINVNGVTVKNYNNDEAKKLISELDIFINFASKNAQTDGKEWTIACLTFYKGQEAKIRGYLQKLTGKESAFSNFNIERNGKKINIKLHTVDKFQGHEADIVFLSMVQTFRDGFMDNPNRLNVAITRAKFQLVIIGDYNYFSTKSRSEDLKQLVLNTQIHK